MAGDEQTPSDANNGQQNPPPSSDQASAGASNGNTPNKATPTGSTPTPAPPRRLDSITRPSSSTGRGGKPVIAPKPKFAGRRSATARQEAEQAEAARKAAEQEAAKKEADRKAKEDRKFGYGRGGERGGRGGRGMRQGRGRGGHMGDTRKEEPVASGPFSSGQVRGEAQKSGWGSSGGGGGSSGAFGGGGGPGGSRSGGGGGGGGGGKYGSGGRSYGGTGSIKTEPGMGDITMRGMPIKTEDGGYISSDDEVEVESSGPKQNIDQMQIVDLTGADAQLEQHGLAPVRLTRVPHQERHVGLNVEEEDEFESDDGGQTSEKKKGKQKAKDLEMTGATERPKRPTAYSSSDTDGEPHIKEEPTDDEHQTIPTTPVPADDTAAVYPPRDATSSPETKRKAKAKVKALVDGELDDFPMPPKPRFQTQAESDEWDRKYDDLRQIRAELGQLLPKDALQPDADGDAAMADNEARQQVSDIQQEREQGTYIFQFPPILPPLKPVTIKDDPDNIRVSHTDDAMDVDQQQSTDPLKAKAEEPAQAEPLKLPAGSVGKLRIHKSGKATLDWGGTTLVLGMGTDATFLQTILLARMPEKKPEVNEGGEASASKEQQGDDQEPTGLGMGQIRGKFVLTPDFDVLF